jgi:hypothetical protein
MPQEAEVTSSNHSFSLLCGHVKKKLKIDLNYFQNRLKYVSIET